MLSFKEFINSIIESDLGVLNESQWMYHGTPSDFETLTPNRDHFVLDRAIGTHFASDENISDYFSRNLQSNYYEPPKKVGFIFKTKKPPRSQIMKVPNRKGTYDQYAIASFVGQQAFDHPEGKDLFKQWVKETRGATDEQAELLHQHLTNGLSVNDKNKFGNAADSANTIKSYVDSRGSSVSRGSSDFREKLLNQFFKVMREKNIKALVYQNTSPMETKITKEQNRSPNCYILFHPEEHSHPITREVDVKNQKKLADDFIKRIKSKEYTDYHIDEAHNNGYLTDDVKNALAHHLHQTIQSSNKLYGYFDSAKKYNYLNDDIKNAAANVLLNIHKNGTLHDYHLEHSIEYGYNDILQKKINDYNTFIETQPHEYMNQIKSGKSIDSIFDEIKENNPENDNIRYNLQNLLSDHLYQIINNNQYTNNDIELAKKHNYFSRRHDRALERLLQ